MANWWEQKNKSLLSGELATYLDKLKVAEGPGQRKAFACSLLYGDVPLSRAAGQSYSFTNTNKQIAYNLCQMVVDTVVAKLTKSRPRPFFVTSGGTFSQKRRSVSLNKYIDGVFGDINAYDLGALVLRDACITGDGLLHVYNENGKIKAERVLRSEILVDEAETAFGEPRQMHRTKVVTKAALINRFPKFKFGIENSVYDPPMNLENLDYSNMVEVAESWLLPSGPNAKDGRHVISIRDEILLDEKWERDTFPIIKLSWSPQVAGYWSHGLVEQLMPLQSEMNMLLWMITQSIRVGGTFKLFLPIGSQISDQEVNGKIGKIIKGTQPPQYLTPPLVQPEIYRHINDVERRSLARAGINSFSASGQAPTGVESGIALRTVVGQEDSRFLDKSRRYDGFFVNVADAAIDNAKEIPSSKVKVRRGQFLEEIAWSQIDVDRSEYTLQCFSINSLTKEPVGRLSQIAEWVDRGFLNKKQARRLMDFPDTEQVEDLANAAEEYILKCMEDIVDKGLDIMPDPMDDLEFAEKYSLETLAQAKTFDADEETQTKLRRYFLQVKELKAAAKQAALLEQQAMQPEVPQQGPAQEALPPGPASQPQPQTQGM